MAGYLPLATLNGSIIPDDGTTNEWEAKLSTFLQPAEWAKSIYVHHTWTRLNVLAFDVADNMIETVTSEKEEEE